MSAAENEAVGPGEREQEELEVLADLRRSLEELEEEESRPTPYNLALNKILGASTRVEIDEAKEVIRRWIEEHPGDNLEFRRYGSDLFRKEKELELEEERRRGWGPREWKREEEVVQRAYRAGTSEEVAGAREALEAWLQEHPEDADELEDAEDALEEKEMDLIEVLALRARTPEEVAGAREAVRAWREKHPGDAEESDLAEDVLREKEEKGFERFGDGGGAEQRSERDAGRPRDATRDPSRSSHGTS